MNPQLRVGLLALVCTVAIGSATAQTRTIVTGGAAAAPGAHVGSAGATEGTAVVLWDQSATPAAFGFVDQVFSDAATYDTFEVHDISTGGAVWNVTEVTTSYTQGNGTWSAATITSASLQVYPKTGTLPSNATDNPPEYIVPATLVAVGLTSWDLVADTSGIAELQCIQGDYWIGLTPNTTFALHGQEFHWATAVIGDISAYRNPGGAFGLGTLWGPLTDFDPAGTSAPNYDGTILLKGDVLVDTWVDLGGGLASTHWGVIATAAGTGISCVGQTVSVSCIGCGPPFGTTNLVIGATVINLPFKGGVMVPKPDLYFALPTGAAGDVLLTTPWPVGAPAGFVFTMQFWQNEPPWSASNALEVTAQ